MRRATWIADGRLAAAATLLALTCAGQEVALTTGDAALIIVDHGPVQELKDPGAAPGSGITASRGDGSRSSPWVFEFTPGGGGLKVNAFKVCANFDAVELGNTDGGASFTLDMGGDNVSGTSGNVSFDTSEETGGWEGHGSGHIAICHVGAVNIGSIKTYNWAYYESAGDVRVGQPVGSGDGPATGDIRIDRIDAHDTQGPGGYVKIYGAGDVRISTDEAVPVAGDIDAHQKGKQDLNSPYTQIEVLHQGDFVARDILTCLHHVESGTSQWFGDYDYVGGVRLDGGGAGAAVMRDIDTSLDIRKPDGSVYGSTPYWRRAGDVAITNYTRVTVRTIDTHHATVSNEGDADGGNVSITGVRGSITVQGELNLGVAGLAANQDPGTLDLQCGGVITLEQGLDLAKVRYAHFNSGGKIYVMGKLTGFPTATPGNGKLDAPAGQQVCYKPNVPENAYLGGKSYTLKSGGVLRSAPAGTVVFVK